MTVIHTTDVFVCKLLCEHLFSFLLDTHLGIAESWQLHDESFEDLAECFPQCLLPFPFLPMMYGDSNFHVVHICLSVVATTPTGVLVSQWLGCMSL